MANQLPVIDELSCEGCGACCRYVGHPMYLRLIGDELYVDPRYETLPEALKSELDDYMENLADNDWGQPCIWLNPATKLCRHYEHRPEMCREFPLGGDDCLRIRKAALQQQDNA